MSSSEILSFASNMTMNYKNEFRFSQDNIKILNQKYRDIRSKIEENLKIAHYKPNNEAKHIEWIKHVGDNNVLLFSLIHMHFNRLFTNNQRVYEFITYHFFCKAYDSVIKQISNK